MKRKRKACPLPPPLLKDPPIEAWPGLLMEHGYLYLGKRIPADMCTKLRGMLVNEFSEKQRQSDADGTTMHEEEPVENFSPATQAMMTTTQDWVVDNILKPGLSSASRRVFIPKTV